MVLVLVLEKFNVQLLDLVLVLEKFNELKKKIQKCCQKNLMTRSREESFHRSVADFFDDNGVPRMDRMENAVTKLHKGTSSAKKNNSSAGFCFVGTDCNLSGHGSAVVGTDCNLFGHGSAVLSPTTSNVPLAAPPGSLTEVVWFCTLSTVFFLETTCLTVEGPFKHLEAQ